MAKEIERKFLVKNENWKQGTKNVYICQAYLFKSENKQVRIRLLDDEAFIAVKSSKDGIIRQEYEYKIPKDDANEIIMNLCEKPYIEKYRYYYHYMGYLWEIDEFLGDNKGLIVAEIELENENKVFEKPDWVGEEVTHDKRYYNSNLVSNPYKNW